jgi:hypothetical protein
MPQSNISNIPGTTTPNLQIIDPGDDGGGGGGGGSGGGGTFTTGTFYVQARDGSDVAAKYLRDDFGNFIMQPGMNQPFIVPANFDVHEALNVFSSMHLTPIDVLEGNGVAQVVLELYNDFKTVPGGARFDIQRYYNGQHSNTFVPAFTPAANWLYGISAAAAGLDPNTALLASGASNVKNSWSNSNIDTSGYAGNPLLNVPNIVAGYNDLNGPTVISYDPPDKRHLDVSAGNAQWSIDISLHDKGTSEETMVQVGQNVETGTKTVSIQTDDYGVVFGSDDEVDYWSNDTSGDGAPGGIYDPYYDYSYGYGYGYALTSSPDSAVSSVSTSSSIESTQSNLSPSGRFFINPPVTSSQTQSGQHEQLISAMATFAPTQAVVSELNGKIGEDHHFTVARGRLAA